MSLSLSLANLCLALTHTHTHTTTNTQLDSVFLGNIDEARNCVEHIFHQGQTRIVGTEKRGNQQAAGAGNRNKKAVSDKTEDADGASPSIPLSVKFVAIVGSLTPLPSPTLPRASAGRNRETPT